MIQLQDTPEEHARDDRDLAFLKTLDEGGITIPEAAAKHGLSLGYARHLVHQMRKDS